jgi:glycosyltransferase involved in cell wall biosynthesis
MRIGIDGRELFGKPTGVGRYLAQILAHWDTNTGPGQHEFVLFHPSGEHTGSVGTHVGRARLTMAPVGGGDGTRWEQLHLPLAMHQTPVDVLFAPAYTAPVLTRTPVVQTIHDLSFFAHPEWFRRTEGLRRRWLTRASARRARVVLTDSDWSRGEIVRWLGVAPERIRVIRLGVTPPVSPPGALPREPLVLFVGSIFNRRHLPDLIEAFAIVVQRHPAARLEIVGDDRTHPRQDLLERAAARGVAGRVGLRAYVSDDVLAGLYARASVFAFLSEYEGFGLTPLEALASGVPVVAGDTPIAREIYGDAARYVAIGDVAATARALEAVLMSHEARRATVDAVPALLARYSWKQAAADTLRALEEAGGGRLA